MADITEALSWIHAHLGSECDWDDLQDDSMEGRWYRDVSALLAAPPTSGLIAALARAQSKFGPIVKRHTNPAFKSQYADVADVLDVVRPVLAEEGLVLVQSTKLTDIGTVLKTRVIHVSGGMLESEFLLPVEGVSAQQVGSLFTYHRRYQACAILGVHPEGDDDDGNAAQTAPQADSRKWRAIIEPEDIEQSREAVQEAIAGLSDADRELVKLECRNQKIPSLRKPGATRAQLDGLVEFLAGLTARSEPFGTWTRDPEGDGSGSQHPAEEERPPFEPVVANGLSSARASLPGSQRKALDSSMKAEKP